MAKFNVQIPTEIVRSSLLSAGEFVLLTKLIQAYYIQPEKSLNIKIDHRALMYFSCIKDQTTLNKTLKSLNTNKMIESYTSPLPRKGALEITLNEKIIPQLNKESYFTQMSSNVLHKNVVEVAGNVGIRLLYYYKSYINTKDFSKQFCFVAEETTAKDLGITEKTVIKYNKILEKRKFIKIEKHKLEENGYDYKGRYTYTRYNNHYFIRQDKIDEYCEKSSALLV